MAIVIFAASNYVHQLSLLEYFTISFILRMAVKTCGYLAHHLVYLTSLTGMKACHVCDITWYLMANQREIPVLERGVF